MDLDTFIIAVFCWIDEAIPQILGGCRLRERGPAPTLWDSEVLTMEVVGEYLGLVEDSALFAYFRQHYGHFFPALSHVHRTTFVRQAANLWRLKEQLWQDVLRRVPHDEPFAIIDSFPLPVCQFARAHRCRRFRTEAAFGKDTLARQTFDGLRVHVRLEWPGVITRFGIAAANGHELRVLPALTEATQGSLVGDRNYWAPKVVAEWQQRGVEVLAPYRKATQDPHPRWSAQVSRARFWWDVDAVLYGPPARTKFWSFKTVAQRRAYLAVAALHLDAEALAALEAKLAAVIPRPKGQRSPLHAELDAVTDDDLEAL